MFSNLPTLTTGDDAKFIVQLYKGENNFVINPTATVKAAVVTLEHDRVLLPAIEVVESEIGSDWFNSIVAVKFHRDATEIIPKSGKAFLEIEIEDETRLTWFLQILIIKGNI